MRRPMLSVATGYAAGVVCGWMWEPPLPWLFIAGGLSLSVCLFHRCKSDKWLAMALIFGGWTNMAICSIPVSPWDLRLIMGDEAAYVRLVGRLVSTPEERPPDQEGRAPRTVALVQVDTLWLADRDQPARGRVIVRTPDRVGREYFQGRRVAITGVLRRPPCSRARELFDYQRFLAGRGIHYEVQCESAKDWALKPSGSDPAVPPWSDRFQDWGRKVLGRGLPEADEFLPLLWAMTVGWRSALTDEVAQPFRHSGTMHIFAISGLHIGMISAILVALCRAVRVSRGWCGLLIIPALWFYAAATGWQASAVRATLMSSLVLAGWSLRRPLDPLNSLAGAALLILIWEPRQLFQAGFQLSFSVVLSIVLVVPYVHRLQAWVLQPDPLVPASPDSRWRRALVAAFRYLSGSLAVSLAATLGALPWMAYYFNLCTPVSLLANLAVVPLAAVALMSSLGSLLTAAWCPLISECYNQSAWLGMVGMTRISQWAAELPGAWFYLPRPHPLVMAGYYGLLVALGYGGNPFATDRRIAAIALCALALAIGWIVGWEPTALRITVLPLRGGDSLFIDAPGKAEDLLIDTGDSSSAESVTGPFLRARGVNRLSNLVVTHGDLRHMGGAALIRQEFRVGRTITSHARSRSPAYRELTATLAEDTANGRRVQRGDEICGWSVLHPGGDDEFGRADDNALVLWKDADGVRILLCSDLGRAGQRTLLERDPDLRADIVIAGMPNPDEPLADGFLRVLRPGLIVVSAGEYPAAERPSGELRRRLGAHGVPVLFTCDHGAVYLAVQDRSWRVDEPAGPVHGR